MDIRSVSSAPGRHTPLRARDARQERVSRRRVSCLPRIAAKPLSRPLHLAFSYDEEAG